MKTNKELHWFVDIDAQDYGKKSLDSKDNLNMMAHFLDALNIKNILSFHVLVSVQRKRKNRASLSAHVEAVLVQECVLSLEDIQEKLSFEIERIFILEEDSPVYDEAEAQWDDENLIYQQWDGHRIDILELLQEEMLIHINPYPKKRKTEENQLFDSVDFVPSVQPRNAKAQKDAFSVLKKLKNKL